MRRNKRATSTGMQVFLSYAAKDSEIARDLASRLTKNGLEVWLAEDHVYPGDNAHLKIGEALEDSDAMVVLLSPDAVKSPQVLNEIGFALGARQFKNKLVPVLVRPTNRVPWILRKMQVIRAKRNLKETGKEIAKALKRSA